MKKYLIVSVAVLTVILGCNHKEKTKRIAEIDSLNTLLDSIKTALDTVNFSDVEKYQSIFSRNLEDYKKYNDGGKDDKTWPVITQYFSIKKGFKRYIEDYDSFRKELKYSRNQLESLKKDVKRNIISKEDYSKYINTEKQAIGFLHHEVIARTSSLRQSAAIFNKCNSRMLEIIGDMKTKSLKNPAKKQKAGK